MTSVKVGQIYKTNSFGDVEIIEYINANKIKVRFLDTGNTDYFRAQKIQQGSVRDKYKPVVAGVGFMGNYKKDPLYKKCYSVWCSMIYRCYNKNYANYGRYGARGVTVDPRWHDFSNYQMWYNANYREGFEVDKELTDQHSLLHSPETCSFVPDYVNKCIIETAPSQKGLPVGVSELPSGKYISRVNTRNDRLYLGTHDTPLKAYEEYKKAKQEYLDFLADEQFLLGNINASVYTSLKDWEIRAYEQT